jgi:hypothetical protein
MTGFAISRNRKNSASPSMAATPEQGFRSRDKALRNTLIECRDAPSYVLEIQKLWEDAADSFLTIGRYLVQAKKTLNHGEFEHMVRSQLPFDKNVAHRLRRVAEDIDKGRLDQSMLPRNYTTIYRFVTMDDVLLDRARRDGVMNPEVTHRQIQAFMQKVRAEQIRLMAPANHAELTAKRRALQDELGALEEAVAEKRRLLVEIEAALEGQPPIVIEGVAEATE